MPQRSLKDINKALRGLKGLLPLNLVSIYSSNPSKSFFPHVWAQDGTLYVRRSQVDLGNLVNLAACLALSAPEERLTFTPGQHPGLVKGTFGSCTQSAIEAWMFAFAVRNDIHPMSILKSYKGYEEKAPTLNLPGSDFTEAGANVHLGIIEGAHVGVKVLEMTGFALPRKFPSLKRWTAHRVFSEGEIAQMAIAYVDEVYPNTPESVRKRFFEAINTKYIEAA